MENSDQIVIYTEEDGNYTFQVRLVENSIWLSQKQMSTLFDKDSDTISLHLKNIYKSGELQENATTEKFSVVRQEGNRRVNRKIKFYNLDAIISVGYRVNSKKGTQFRFWATRILKEHLEKGFTLNRQRLDALRQSIKLIDYTTRSEDIPVDESKQIISILSDYALGLDILDGYDHHNLEVSKTSPDVNYRIDYHDALYAIQQLREKFGGSELFGRQKDQSFRSSIATIDQTFDGRELYPSLEEKAANLLYLVVKNHSFTDGNKRIAAWLFIWYLDKNDYLYDETGHKKIANNALASLTLMIALTNQRKKIL